MKQTDRHNTEDRKVTTVIISVYIESSDTYTQEWFTTVNREARHVSGIARKSQCVVEQGRWQSGSTKFGAQHEFCLRYVLPALEGVDAEAVSRHHQGFR